MTSNIEASQRPDSSIFRVNYKAERVKKVLARGSVDGNRSALVLMERRREIEVFPGMIGSFKIPIGSMKYRKFIDSKR